MKIVSFDISYLDQIISLEFGLYKTPWRFNKMTIKKLLDSKNINLIAHQDNLVLGYSFAFAKCNHLRICKLTTSLKQRRRGIATALLDETIKQNGNELIKLTVRKNNLSAIRFYYNYGFTIEEKLSDYYNKSQGDNRVGLVLSFNPRT